MRTILFLTAILFIGRVEAQQTIQPIRLSDCIMQALGKNPSMQISEAKVQAAEARSSEITTALLPQLKFSGRAAELSKIDPFGIKLGPPINFSMVLFPSITENYSTRLTLQQPIFMGFKLSKNREMAQLNASAMHEDLNKDQLDLILNVINAYWNLYRALKIEEVIRQSVEQISEHLKDITNLEKQGLATGADVMRVQVQVSDVKVKHIEAKNTIRLTTMALNSMLRNDLNKQIQPIDTPAITRTGRDNLLNEDLQLLQMQAYEHRPEMKSVKLRQEMYKAGVSAAKGGWYPQIFFAANYDYSRPNQRIIPPKDQWDGTWDVGVTLQWNIWDWNAAGYQTEQAEASVRQIDATITQLTDLVTLEVSQQYFNVQTAIEKVDVAQNGVEQAQESFRMTSEKFKNGVASNSELLDAENALMQAKLTHTQAEVECTLALSGLKRAVGDFR